MGVLYYDCNHHVGPSENGSLGTRTLLHRDCLVLDFNHELRNLCFNAQSKARDLASCVTWSNHFH